MDAIARMAEQVLGAQSIIMTELHGCSTQLQCAAHVSPSGCKFYDMVEQQSNLETADTDGGSEGLSKVDDIDSNIELTLPGKETIEAIINIEPDLMRDDIDSYDKNDGNENIESTRNTESRRDFESNIKPKDHLVQPQHQDRTVEQQSNLETADTDGRSEGHSKVDDIDGKETFEAINNIEPNLVSDDIDSNAKIDGKENIELTLPGKETIDASNHLVQPQHQDHTVIQQSNLETADTDGRSVGHSKVDDIDFNDELTIPGKETIEAINSIEPDLMRDDIDSNAKPQICTPKEPAKPTSETLVAAAPSGTPAPDSSHNTGADDLACTVCDPGTAKDMCGTCAEQIKVYPVKYSVSFKSLSQYGFIHNQVIDTGTLLKDNQCDTFGFIHKRVIDTGTLLKDNQCDTVYVHFADNVVGPVHARPPDVPKDYDSGPQGAMRYIVTMPDGSLPSWCEE